MIDTIKIISMIDINTYNIIKSKSTIKTSYNNSTGEVYYNIVVDSLQGSYNSNLCVRIGRGTKYNFANMYYIEIEGSYHKITKGYNSHNGFYNIADISYNLIKLVENAYSIKLPTIKHWFLQRIDIALCFDLKNQEDVKKYINNLSLCNYPRRNLKHYEGESIYITGNTTTLKIYNKRKEFEKNDLSKLKNSSFDIASHLNTIKGYIRFECEIKKRKLKYIYNKNYIRVTNCNYNDLKKIWYQEFNKFFKHIENDLTIVNEREQVKNRLFSTFSKIRARNLYNFYLSIIIEGLQNIKTTISKSAYYKNLADLKKANIDFSQKKENYNNDDNIINFNPFEEKEIL